MAKAILHDGEHLLVVAAFGVEDPIRSQADAGESGSEQVAARQSPKHHAVALAGKPGGNSRSEENRGAIVGDVRPRPRHLVQGGDGKAAAGEAGVQLFQPERQHGRAARTGTGRLDSPHLGPQGGQTLTP